MPHFPPFALRSRLSISVCESQAPAATEAQTSIRPSPSRSSKYRALEGIQKYRFIFPVPAEHWLQACQVSSVQSTSLTHSNTSTSHNSKQGMGALWASWTRAQVHRAYVYVVRKRNTVSPVDGDSRIRSNVRVLESMSIEGIKSPARSVIYHGNLFPQCHSD